MSTFIDRAAALIEERRSQVCLGLDPDPASVGGGPVEGTSPPSEAAAEAVLSFCVDLIDRAGPLCIAVKPQMACFERLGWRGFRVLEEVCGHARQAGLLVIADGKRGDVPVSAKVYAEALTDGIDSPWGRLPGLGADAFTINPFTGLDSLEPFVAKAEETGSGVFALVRTSNPGAADIQDLDTADGTVSEHVAGMVAGLGERLVSKDGSLTGMGAVVGATEPAHLEGLRDLMPRSIFLIPGVGAQGGRPEDLAPAFRPGRAGAIVTASRSIAGDPDPAAAAERLRETLWSVSAGSDQTG